MSRKVLEAVLQKKVHSVPPVWFMRQAGRHLPQYHKLKEEFGGSFLDRLLNKDFIRRATLQPVDQYDLDAAIIFSDILLIPYILGMGIEYEGGARVTNPISSEVTWGEPDFSMIEAVYEGVRGTRLELAEDKSLIGFCPAPWTIFCYMADGRGKEGKFPNALSFLSKSPRFVTRTLHMLGEIVAEHLMLQIRYGADVAQIFDTHVESIPEEAYNGLYKEVLERIRLSVGGIPLIYFGKNMEVRDFIMDAFDCVSLGPNVSLKEAKKIQEQVCIQGNLRPELAAGDLKNLIPETRQIVNELREGPFIFNLGHGVLPNTPVANLTAVVNEIRSQYKENNN